MMTNAASNILAISKQHIQAVWNHLETDHLPWNLVCTGFYYHGIDYWTIWFNCSGALANWRPTDDLLNVHDIFPKCQFIQCLNALDHYNNIKNYLLKKYSYN